MSCRLFATDYYWVGGAGNWSDLAHWRTPNGATSIPAVVPNQYDNVFFDQNSGFTSTSNTVTIDVIANCKNMTWIGAPSNPFLNSANYELNIYGDLTLQEGMFYYVKRTNFNKPDSLTTYIDGKGVNMNGEELSIYLLGRGDYVFTSDFSGKGLSHNLNGNITFMGKYSNFGSTRGLTTLTGRGYIVFNDDIIVPYSSFNIGGVKKVTARDLKLVTAHFNVTADTLDITNDSIIVSESYNESVGKLYALGSNIMYDGYYDFVVSNNKSYHNVYLSYPRVQFWGNGLTANKIVFEGMGIINFTNSRIHRLETKGDAYFYNANVYDTLELTPSFTYTFQSGVTQTVNDVLYASGNPCFIIYLNSSSVGSRANINFLGTNNNFNFANIRDINAVTPINYGDRTTNVSNNSGINFTTYNTGELHLLGQDTALLCTRFPYILDASLLSDNANTSYIWSTNDTTSAISINDYGTYRITTQYGNNCVIRDTIEISRALVVPQIIESGKSVNTSSICAQNNYNYYIGDTLSNSIDKGVLAINPNGNNVVTTQVSVNNQGTLTGGLGTFSNTGSGYYESRNATYTTRITKRLHSVTASGNFTQNGGAIVRIYYDASDTVSLLTDATAGNRVIARKGWFVFNSNSAAQTVASLTPTNLVNMQAITPISQGVENGVLYAEFQVENLESTFGYYASTKSTPDLTPSIQIRNAQFSENTERDFVLDVFEITNNLASHNDGKITIRISKMLGFDITVPGIVLSATAQQGINTISQTYSARANQNSRWTFRENAAFLIIESLPGTEINGNSGEVIGLHISRKPLVSNNSRQNLSATVLLGSAGDEISTNNTVSIRLSNID